MREPDAVEVGALLIRTNQASSADLSISLRVQVRGSSHARAANLPPGWDGRLRYPANDKAPHAVIRMPPTSNRHARATGGQGCGEVERLDVDCQLVHRHELQGMHAERPRRFHILSAIINEEKFLGLECTTSRQA